MQPLMAHLGGGEGLGLGGGGDGLHRGWENSRLPAIQRSMPQQAHIAPQTAPWSAYQSKAQRSSAQHALYLGGGGDGGGGLGLGGAGEGGGEGGCLPGGKGGRGDGGGGEGLRMGNKVTG